MKNSLLKELANQKTNGCVSVFISMEKKSFADKIDFSKTLTAIRKALKLKLDDATAEACMSRIEGLLEKPDAQQLQHGLGLFVNPYYSKLYYFSFPVKDSIIIDTSFEIRNVIADQNMQVQYGVLMLHKDVVRIFKGQGLKLSEINNQDFPFEYADIFHPDHFESGNIFKASESKGVITKPEGFLRKADLAIDSVLGDLPLVLVGTDKYVSTYLNVTGHRSKIIGKITGSYSKISNYELSQLVWPSIVNHQHNELLKSIEHAKELIGMQKAVSGIQETWDVVQSGIGKELFVEDGYMCSAFVKYDDLENGHLLLDNTGYPDSIEIPDAVDTLMEVVLNGHDTHIHIVPDGLLKEEGRILLTTKY